MSLILDALRKSEHQRQRQVGPGLAVVAEGRDDSRRPATWLLVVGGLLLLNVVVLVAILLTGRQTDQAAAVTRPPPVVSPAASTTPPPAQARPTRPRAAPVQLPSRPSRDEVRPLTTEVAAAPAQPPVTQTPVTHPPAPRSENSTAVAAPTATPPPASVEQATEDARLPRFTNLVVRGELNVPHMHIDIHVFNSVPAERFVFINMRKYGEGEATQEGPRIERITRDGVVMDYQGQRFFLSRD